VPLKFQVENTGASSSSSWTLLRLELRLPSLDRESDTVPQCATVQEALDPELAGRGPEGLEAIGPLFRPICDFKSRIKCDRQIGPTELGPYVPVRLSCLRYIIYL
jgi:hypothetical protein